MTFCPINVRVLDSGIAKNGPQTTAADFQNKNSSLQLQEQ
ncbi:hypothetical protein GJA_2560 [Janthinobacterium agaricidamnosum NBRC 102515 = DSM 9628]|uniref:Uncharacterized protein n=1 Tax=Janthinobacterium agaricidamnosum NBRC 102515 = DSM 9628 TaxID=1349767 RepID=W0V5N2_9BURK|nr:hypothetical protein GJA_2560 [Janthinobacterium agaricidamnosum NBRC 102515 = DSM 9628]